MKRRTFISSLMGGFGLGILARRAAAVPAAAPGVLLQESPLAGFQHHKAAHVWPYLHEGAALRLIREPANSHDANAVAVYYKGDKLGYLPRRENATLAQMIDRGQRLEARIQRLREDENPWRRIRLQVELIS